MRILYAVCSWGYGHVTRSLPIIRRFIKEGHELTLVANGLPHYMLTQELAEYEGQVRIVDVPDYPMPYTQHDKMFMFKFLKNMPNMLYRINKENDWVLDECEHRRYDLIVSDNRYGIYNRKVPSFLMTHQLRVLAPKRNKFMEWSTERFVAFFAKMFKKFVVPDFAKDSLAGILCHDMRFIDEDQISYIGAISDFPPDPTVVKDLDGYISISGPEPQRSVYERIIRRQLDDLEGRWIMSLGTKKGKKERIGGVTIHPYLATKERTTVLNSTNLVISRSGYTTMMDLAMLGHKALFTPTPGQTEQLYLSDFHNERKTWFSMKEDELDLKTGIERAKRFSGIKRGSSEKAVNKAMDTFFG